jgi:hypothetical protein
MSTLDEIEKRLAAATPGPWEGVDYEVLATEIDIADCQTLADAELIAHAPTDLAALVAFARVVQAARRDLSHHHSHRVPGRWDKDGSICDVCVRVGAMDDALAALERS